MGDAEGGISTEIDRSLAGWMFVGSVGNGTADGKCASCAKSDDILAKLDDKGPSVSHVKSSSSGLCGGLIDL